MTNYNESIPAASHLLSSDQPLMLENTEAIFEILNVDMIGFNTANSGFHNQVTFIDQVSDAGSVSGSVRVYAKSVSGDSQLFYQKDNQSPVYPLAGAFSAAASGYIYLPGGLLMQWGKVMGNSSVVWTFPIPFPNNVFMIQATKYQTSSSVNPVNVGDTNMPAPFSQATIYGANNFSAYVLAIGN